MAEAPIGSHLNWNYNLDNSNKTITLKRYLGDEINVSVYGTYEIDGIIYHTKIFNDGNTTSACLFAMNENIETITFYNNIDTSTLTNMGYMFYNCSSLKNIVWGNNFNTSNVNNMDNVFDGCSSLSSIDLDSFDTRNVESMYGMFANCSSLTTLDLTSFDTGNIRTNINSNGYIYMFVNCSSLKTIYVSKDNWKKSTGEGMFQGCGTSSVTYI